MYKSIVLLLLLASNVYAGNPAKDLYGSIDSYSKSKTIIVIYNEARPAQLLCERLGFKVKEDYKPGSHFICQLNQNTQFRKLIELVSDPSIKSVEPNPTLKAVE